MLLNITKSKQQNYSISILVFQVVDFKELKKICIILITYIHLTFITSLHQLRNIAKNNAWAIYHEGCLYTLSSLQLFL
jgi:hypothetical protein